MREGARSVRSKRQPRARSEVDESDAEDHVGLVVAHTLDHGVAVGDPVRLEVHDQVVGVALGREDPHALHHRAAGGDLIHVLPREVGCELAPDLGLHRHAPAVAVGRVLERGASIDRAGSGP